MQLSSASVCRSNHCAEATDIVIQGDRVSNHEITIKFCSSILRYCIN